MKCARALKRSLLPSQKSREVFYVAGYVVAISTVRRYLIFLKAIPDSLHKITSRIGCLFHGHQNWIHFLSQHAVQLSYTT